MQRVHERRAPLTEAELAAAREAESHRKEWDPDYITAEEARAIPPEVLRSDRHLQWRITYSQSDWPENRMSATAALGPLQAGEGEEVTDRSPEAADLFWDPDRHA